MLGDLGFRRGGKAQMSPENPPSSLRYVLLRWFPTRYWRKLRIQQQTMTAGRTSGWRIRFRRSWSFACCKTTFLTVCSHHHPAIARVLLERRSRSWSDYLSALPIRRASVVFAICRYPIVTRMRSENVNSASTMSYWERDSHNLSLPR